MKRLAILTFPILFLTACGGSNLSKHVDSKNGFEISFPTEWDTSSIDQYMAFMALESYVDSTDLFAEGFSVSAVPNEGHELTEIVEQNIMMAEMYYQGVEIKREDITTEAGLNGIQLSLDYEREGIQLTNYASFFNSETSLFTITQSVETSKVETYKPIFEEVINSFTLAE